MIHTVYTASGLWQSRHSASSRAGLVIDGVGHAAVVLHARHDAKAMVRCEAGALMGTGVRGLSSASPLHALNSIALVKV